MKTWLTLEQNIMTETQPSSLLLFHKIPVYEIMSKISFQLWSCQVERWLVKNICTSANQSPTQYRDKILSDELRF